MRRSLSFLALGLVTTIWVNHARAAVSVAPVDGCPSSEAITARLQRLGALDQLSRLGAAEVRVEAPSLRLHFRDRKGDALGERVVTAPPDCEARATLAAAVIAAFAGEWAQTALAAPPAASAKATTSTTARLPWRFELGTMVFALHDGDQGGWGAGARADLGRGAWFLTGLFEGSSERQQPLGLGQGGYRFLRAGVGLGLRQRWSRWFWDASLLPMVDRLSLRGKALETNLSASSWGFVASAQTRLGWSVWRLRPFLFAGVSYRIPVQRMTLLDRPDLKVPLSAFNVEAGLGISFEILP